MAVYAVVRLVEVEELASSIPDGVIGSFHWHNPSGRTMALGPTQPLTEMRTRSISWGIKEASAYGWLHEHLYVPIFEKFWEHQPPGDPVQACTGIALVTIRQISSDRLLGFYAVLEDTFISTFRRNVLFPSLV